MSLWGLLFFFLIWTVISGSAFNSLFSVSNWCLSCMSLIFPLATWRLPPYFETRFNHIIYLSSDSDIFLCFNICAKWLVCGLDSFSWGLVVSDWALKGSLKDSVPSYAPNSMYNTLLPKSGLPGFFFFPWITTFACFKTAWQAGGLGSGGGFVVVTGDAHRTKPVLSF